MECEPQSLKFLAVLSSFSAFPAHPAALRRSHVGPAVHRASFRNPKPREETTVRKVCSSISAAGEENRGTGCGAIA
jgi:hypothetical protein